MTRKMSAFFVALIFLWPVGTVWGTLTAHFSVYEIRNLCNAEEDYDPWPYEPPEPQYRASILDVYGDSYHDDCGFPDDRCGSWNFSDYTVVRAIPGSSIAWFYFGLFDSDYDSDDVIGNHWKHPWTSMSGAAWEWNNDNAHPDYSPVCDDNESDGYAYNYELRHRIWYQDDTAPAGLSAPLHEDDALSDTYYDNDTRLDFTWSLASDPDSGISGYFFKLRDNTTGQFLYSSEPAPADGSISLCPSGCDKYLNPVHNHEYRFSYGAANGNYPQVSNPQTSWSVNVYALVDLVNPSSSITAPPASSWHRSDMTVTFVDSDDGSGLDETGCRWRVVSDGVTQLDWTSRPCNGEKTVSVGPAGLCRDQGQDICEICADSQDLSRRSSTVTFRTFGIDWSSDTVEYIGARTEESGEFIIEGEWTSDRDPYFFWFIDTDNRYAPIIGYSWALNNDPDCVTLELTGGDMGELQLQDNALEEGTTFFKIRSADEAGNCGNVAQFIMKVDATEDTILNLTAYTEEGGFVIPEETWQQDNDPFISWEPSQSTAPIDGYAVSADITPPCEPSVANNYYQFPQDALTDGQHIIYVRAMDEAGNCGPAAEYHVWVQTNATTDIPDPTPTPTPTPDITIPTVSISGMLIFLFIPLFLLKRRK